MEKFPTEYFLNTSVRLLEYIKYRDSNYTREERIENLHYAYTKAAQHFAQPRQQQLLKVAPFGVTLPVSIVPIRVWWQTRVCYRYFDTSDDLVVGRQ